VESGEEWNGLGDAWIAIEEDIIVAGEHDEREAEEVKDKAVTVENMQTFKNVACKKLKLPLELVEKYRQWL